MCWHEAGIKWTFTLPVPPSVNQLWKPVAYRFVNSAKYNDWHNKARFEMLIQSKPRRPLEGKLAVELKLPAGDLGDVDNRAKAAIDMLQHAKVIGNDRDVDDLHVYRDAGQRKGTCQISVCEAA